jgi:hypothetical protein
VSKLGLDGGGKSTTGLRPDKMLVQVKVRARHEQRAPLVVTELVDAFLLSTTAKSEDV